MTIRIRVFIIALMTGVTVGAVAAVGITRMLSVGSELEEIVHEDIPLTNIVTKITLHQLEQAILLERTLRGLKVTAGTDVQKDWNHFLKLAHQVDDEIVQGEEIAQHAIDHALTPESLAEFRRVLKLLKRIEGEHATYDQHAEMLMAAAQAGNLDRPETVELIETIEREQEHLDKVLEGLLLELEAFTEASAQHALAIEQAGITEVSVVGALGIALGVLLGGWIGASISQPIRRLTHTMGQLADGNLTTDVTDLKRRCEVGAMARSVDVFKQNALRMQALEAEQEELRIAAEHARIAALRHMADTIERETANAVANVEHSTSEMKTSAVKMRNSSTRVSDNATNVAGAAEQSLRNAQTVACATEELSASIAEIIRQVGSQASIADTARQHADLAAQTIEELTEAADTVGEMVQSINEIAHQTDMLAMNATIEAARAGTAGQGFAVVAAEVKELAGQTARVTEDIKTHVTRMQEKTNRSVTSITTVAETIHEMNEISIAVSSAMEEQGAATREIAGNVSETTQASQDVTNQITLVSGEVNESLNIAEEVTVSSATVAKQVGALQQSLNRIVRSASDDVDRRQDTRAATPQGVTVQLTANGASFQTDVLDQSAGGLRTQPIPALRSGMTVDLDSDRLGIFTRAMVIESGDAHARFTFMDNVARPHFGDRESSAERDYPMAAQ